MKDKKNINAKCKRAKNPLTDKQKDERKHKIKKVCKTILDIIVYIFAGFMFIGLIFGCSNQYKKASASFYSENYTSLNQVSLDRDDDLRLYYYYSVDYKKTFPDYASIVGANVNTWASVSINGGFRVDNTTYTHIYCTGYSSSSVTIGLILDNTTLGLVRLETSNTTILRPDLLSQLFGGTYNVFTNSTGDNSSTRFYRWLVYYLSNKGYSRVNYSMPITPIAYNYLFVNSSNPDNYRFGGYMFRNDAIYEDFPEDSNAYHPITVFSGCFRSNGVLYSSIEFGFATVYGNYLDSASQWREYHYYLDDYGAGSGATDKMVADSSNDFYKAWYYLSRIFYIDFNGNKTTVWTVGEWYRSVKCDVNLNGSWVGDTETSVSPYRNLYILYGDDYVNSVDGNFEYFPQISHSSYAQYLNLIGDGYVSQIPGGQQDDNSGYFSDVFSWFSMALTGLLPLLGYSLVPGITIATIIMIPVSVTIILFVVKLFKR